MKPHVPLLAVVLMLTGCIESEDYGKLWASGTVMSNLVGRWHSEGQDIDIGISSNVHTVTVHVKESPGYTNSVLPKQLSRAHSYSFPATSVRLGNHSFLLCKNFTLVMLESWLTTNFPSADGHSNAALIRYSIERNDLNIFLPDLPRIQALIDEGVIAGRKTPPPSEPGMAVLTNPYLERFDEETLGTLSSLFSQTNIWGQAMGFTRRTREQAVGGDSVKAADGLR